MESMVLISGWVGRLFCEFLFTGLATLGTPATAPARAPSADPWFWGPWIVNVGRSLDLEELRALCDLTRKKIFPTYSPRQNAAQSALLDA